MKWLIIGLMAILIILGLYFGWGRLGAIPMGVNLCYADSSTTCETQKYRGSVAEALIFTGDIQMNYQDGDFCEITANQVCHDVYGVQGECTYCYLRTECEDKTFSGTVINDACEPSEPLPAIGSWRGIDGWYSVEIKSTIIPPPPTQPPVPPQPPPEPPPAQPFNWAEIGLALLIISIFGILAFWIFKR